MAPAVKSNAQITLEALLDEFSKSLNTPLPDADTFELFCAEQILKGADLSMQQIESGIVDQGDDGGIDSIYLLLDNNLVEDVPDPKEIPDRPVLTLHIIQSKATNSFSGNAMNKLASIAPIFLSLHANFDDNKDILHEGVRAQRDLFKRTYLAIAKKHPALNIHFHSCAKAEASSIAPNVSGWSNSILKACKDAFSNANAEVKFLGAQELCDAASTLTPTTFSLFSNQGFLPTTQGSYIALISITELLKFLTDETGVLRNFLFESNVRDFHSKSIINEEIQKSVTSETDLEFWWLNNGLTILVNEISTGGKHINISNPQIVNGLQTCNALFAAKDKIDEQVRNEHNVLVRLIKISESESMDRIIRATNSQNPLAPSAMLALVQLQRDIEKVMTSNSLYYERRRNYYRNRGIHLAKIVTMEFLGQCIMSMRLILPSSARARPSTLLRDEKRQKEIFDDTLSLDEYVAVAKIGLHLDLFIRRFPHVTPSDRTNARFFLMAFVIALLLGTDPKKREPISSISDADLSEDLLSCSIYSVMECLHEISESKSLPEDRVAKGTELTKKLMDLASSL